ncbi:MAG TPA: helicase HerA-like domain-containing protein, partial [Rubrivivax sp.]|nr:helicase HerA-like domain-containing protein [Rubrivivax sp.]
TAGGQVVAPATAPTTPGGEAAAGTGGMGGMLKDMIFGTTGPRGGRRPGLAEAAATSAVRSIGSAVGREIIRGVLGSLIGGKRRR